MVVSDGTGSTTAVLVGGHESAGGAELLPLLDALPGAVVTPPGRALHDTVTSLLTRTDQTAVTFLVSSVWSWVYAVVGTVIAAVVTLAMTDWYGDPHYTWPYILATWVLLVVATFIPALQRPGASPDPDAGSGGG